jgi:hypothetical protein
MNKYICTFRMKGIEGYLHSFFTSALDWMSGQPDTCYRWKSVRYPLKVRVDGSQIRSGRFRVQNNLFSYQEPKDDLSVATGSEQVV